MTAQFEKNIQALLNSKAQQGLLRTRNINGCKLNFASNDYLGLTVDPIVKQYFLDGFSKFPVGSSGSALLSGYHEIHQELEQEFATTYKRDAAILFPSAYAANLAIMILLKNLNSSLLLDKACHASIYDGLELAKITQFKRFLHNDSANLHAKLISLKQPSIIMTESLFSMTGKFAKLPEFLNLAKQYDSAIILDEAHGFGCVGDNGLGMGYKYSQDEIPLIIIGFGKAMGAQGAVVVGQKLWINALLQVARSYIYSTAISPAYSYGLLQTFKYLQTLEKRRQHLQDLIKYFYLKRFASSLDWQESYSPIQFLQLGSAPKAQLIAKSLENRSIYCPAIRPPTVPLKDAGLRVVLSFQHSIEDLDHFFWNLAELS